MSQGQDGLLVSLEARLNQFEKQMQRAANVNSRAMGQIERRSQQAMRNLQTSVAMGANQATAALSALGVQAGGLGGILGAGGVFAGAVAAATAYVGALRSVSAAVAEIGARADRVGVATEELQRLRFASEQAAGSARAVDEGLDRFAKSISEAARGSGELFEILKANNVALTDADGRLRSTSDLFRTYANLVKNAANEQDQLALAVAAFGRSAGEDLVGLLRQGAAGVDELGRAAEEAGAVLDDELVRRAQEIDDKFSALAATLRTDFQRAILEVAGAARELFMWLDRAAGAFGAYSAGPNFGAVTEGTSREIERLREVVRLDDERIRQLRELDARARNMPVSDLTRVQAERDQLAALEGRIEAERILAEALNRRRIAETAASSAARVASGEDTPTVLPTRDEGGGRGSGRAAAARIDAFEREVQAIERRIQALGLDAQASSLSAMEADKLRVATDLLNAAREAGISITPELRAQVDELSQAYAEQAEVVRQLEQVQQQLQQISGMVADGLTDVFTGVLTGAKNAEQAIGQLLQQLGRLLINRAFQALLGGGGGGGGNFLSALFGRATGGPVQAGRAVRVGEFGPETFVPTQPGRIVPADKSGRGGQALTITVNVAGAKGNMEIMDMVRSGVSQGLGAYDRALPGRLQTIQKRQG